MQNADREKEYSAIILAAGKSERLGFPKLSLKYNENTNFIEHIVSEYQQYGCKDIIVVINNMGNKCLIDNDIYFFDIAKVVINEHPDWHRYYSLKLGAKQVKENHFVFIHNVDNPFVNQEILDELLIYSEKADYISPEFDRKGGHPFLISSKVIHDLKASDVDQMHLKEFLNKYSRKRVSVTDENILVNINTLEEYRKYFE